MKRILAFASIGLVMASQAFAADLYQPAPEAPPAEPVIVASNGWYLRGDLSYDFMHLRGAKYYQGSNSYQRGFDSADLDDTGNIGVGVGYQINDYLRVDTTLDYMFDTDFRGSTSSNGTNDGSACDGSPCRSTDRSKMSAFSLMANAYVDIGHYGLFTPYVGAGIGGTRVMWDDLKNTSCNVDTGACDETVTHKGRENWRLTYALMLGTAVDINCNLKADIGYRYRYVNGGSMFGYKLNGGPGRDEGFDIHEARAGLRYNFGDAGCQQAYLPPAEIPQQQPVFK